MASLVEIPQSKSTATLEVLAHLGITQEHLKRIRSSQEYAESIAEFMKHRDCLEPVLALAYALNFTLITRILLKLLKPKLSEKEREYVDKDGPEIVKQHFLHDFYNSGPCMTPEGKTAGRRAEILEEAAKDKLTDVGVSKERQQLLYDLVLYSNADYLIEFGHHLNKVGSVLCHIRETFREGLLTRLLEIAALLNTPKEIMDFLTILCQQAGQFVEKEK